MIVFDCFLHSFARSIDISRLVSPYLANAIPSRWYLIFFSALKDLEKIFPMNSKSLSGDQHVCPSSQSRIIIILPPPFVRHIWEEPKQDERSKKEHEEEEGENRQTKNNCKRLKKGSFSTALDQVF